MSSTRTNELKKKRRFGQYLENLKVAYTVSYWTFPWIGWALGGVLVGVIALAVLVSLAIGQSLGYWIAMSVPLSLMAALVLLTLVTRRASYAQIEGTPGAAKYVLDQAGKGWYVHSSPLAVNPSTQDILWFLVGRPGIVLVAEGPKGRIQRMVTDESKRIQRFLSTVPLHVISVGTQEGQTRLTELKGGAAPSAHEAGQAHRRRDHPGRQAADLAQLEGSAHPQGHRSRALPPRPPRPARALSGR